MQNKGWYSVQSLRDVVKHLETSGYENISQTALIERLQNWESAQQGVYPTGGTDPQIDPDSPLVNPAYAVPGEPTTSG